MREQTGHSFAAYFKRAVSPLMVLGLLKDQAMYGYEISREIDRRSQGKLNIAVLYPVLYRLEEQGYVQISDTTVENGRARSYYSITDAGLAYFEKAAAEFRELAALFGNFIPEVEKSEQEGH